MTPTPNDFPIPDSPKPKTVTPAPPALTVVENKPFWLSKTLWVNAVGLVVVILTYFLNNHLLTQFAGPFAGILSAANLYLRTVSNSVLTTTTPEPLDPTLPKVRGVDVIG